MKLFTYLIIFTIIGCPSISKAQIIKSSYDVLNQSNLVIKNLNKDDINDNNESHSLKTVIAAMPSCELHIFPTLDISYTTPDFGKAGSSYGLLGALISAGLSSAVQGGSVKAKDTVAEQMRLDLRPDVQIKLLDDAGVLKILKLPSDTKVISEPVQPTLEDAKKDPEADRRYKEIATAMRKNKAVINSLNPCYRELYVISVSMHSDIGTTTFQSAFLYRTFDESHSEKHLYDGRQSVPKPQNFPATSPDKVSEASEELHAAFVKSFIEWVARRVKP